ncbi:MAG: dihydrofolate reductase family protein [Bdellovibrionales bacterium]
MRPIKFFIATTADGMIARADGEVDWFLRMNEGQYNDFYDKVDTLIMGRKTFEKILARGPWPYSGKKTYVFSSQLKNQYGPEVEIVSRDPATFVESLKEKPGKEIWLVGGAELARSLMNEQLVDEVILDIHPQMLGNGIQLYPLPLHSMFWEMKESQELPSSLVRVHYRLRTTDIPVDD